MNTPHPDKLPRTQLPDDLIAEVLSWLPVKSLTRFRCVCKSWNTLIISNQTFIKLHFHRSPLRSKPHLLLQRENSPNDHCDFCVTHLSGSGLVENPWISLAHNPRYRLNKRDRYSIAGSCNGLICLHGYSVHSVFQRGWICFWNPATRLMSRKLGSFYAKTIHFKLNFGYDNSTDTYKVVLYDMDRSGALHARVLTLGCNVWRNIQNLPLLPFRCGDSGISDGVHLSGTLNWMTSRNERALYYNAQNITVDQLVILSLDLRMETYTLLALPRGFDEVPSVVPSVGVLMDCLCFSHDSKNTHFVIWQMEEFGNAESWVQLLKISYQDLQMVRLDKISYYHYQLLPLYLYNGDTLILGSFGDDQAILYNKKANTVERTALTTTTSQIILWFVAFEYVESLVSPLRVGSSTAVA